MFDWRLRRRRHMNRPRTTSTSTTIMMADDELQPPNIINGTDFTSTIKDQELCEMSSSTKSRRYKKKSSIINESTLQYCYYSITSLFRNHSKVLLQDGLTKCCIAGRDDNNNDTQQQEEITTDFTTTTSRYHIDTTFVGQPEKQADNEQSFKIKKTSLLQNQENDDDDQVTAPLDTPSPIHTDDEEMDFCTESSFLDDDLSPINYYTNEQQSRMKRNTGTMKFFRHRHGTLV